MHICRIVAEQECIQDEAIVVDRVRNYLKLGEYHEQIRASEESKSA